jgi:virginiamycin B lyase
MSRSSTAALIAAAVFAFVPLAQAQEQGKPSALPQGAGKETVEAVCTQCHQTNMITGSSGYTPDGWKELIGTMIDLSPNPEWRDTITQYLAMPTLGQRSRDPIQAADGSIWWAGQFGNLIGRLNPATGEMREYKLPPNALPHSVWLDDKGIPWYTGNKNGTIGKVDPETGKVTEYKMPDPNAKDPHTAVFDKKGILWFTLQNSNMVGRLDPATGDIKLVTLQTPDSKPYGIKIDADGVPWFACNGSPCLYKIDPATMALTEVKLPYPGTTVRRLDIAEDGMIWYVNSNKGQLGRYDPKTGEIKEWQSPSGPNSHPYAIVVVDGIVWYNESGKRPDALVRFDPKTETFQSWAIPSGGIHAGIIRHMRATREGNLLIHQSSTNRIILVTVKRRAASR